MQVPLQRIMIAHEHHQPGHGEDGPPIVAISSPTIGIVGVFDGLGGAGGESLTTDDGLQRSGAWVASRLVSRITSEVFFATVVRDAASQLPSAGPGSQDSMAPSSDFTAELQDRLTRDLAAHAARMNAGGGSGRLKSRLIKTLPTTLAVCWYDLGKGTCTAIWAGDSRVYYLHPDLGLLQVTTDDLKSNADALENLTQDSPMSNCVSASAEFVLHERHITVFPHSMLIAATDGCFGYVRTPLHFEYLLLSTMSEATDWKDWQDRLQEQIVRVTSDDSTLAGIAIGWQDFASCQARFAARFEGCAQRIAQFSEQYGRVEELERALVTAREALAATTRDQWAEYRQTYEKLMEVPVRDVPGNRDSAGASKQRRPERGQARDIDPDPDLGAGDGRPDGSPGSPGSPGSRGAAGGSEGEAS